MTKDSKIKIAYLTGDYAYMVRVSSFTGNQLQQLQLMCGGLIEGRQLPSPTGEPGLTLFAAESPYINGEPMPVNNMLRKLYGTLLPTYLGPIVLASFNPATGDLVDWAAPPINDAIPRTYKVNLKAGLLSPVGHPQQTLPLPLFTA